MAARIIFYCQWVMVFCMLVHRALFVGMPVFRFSLLQAPFSNTVVGLLSDLGVIFLLVGLLELLKLTKSIKYLRAGAAAAVCVLTFLLCVGLTAHVRYVQHFGTTLRPEHIMLLLSESTAKAGPAMLFENVLPWVQFFLPWLLAWVAVLAYGMYMRAHGQISKRWLYPGFAVLAWCAYSGSLTLRHRPGIEPELKYNIFTAIYMSFKEVSESEHVPPPYSLNYAALHKDHFGPYRKWADPFVLKHFPLWQEEMATGPAVDQQLEEVRSELRTFLKEKVQERGRPWNVVLVLFEAMRAHEIALFGNEEPIAQNLTPNITRTFKSGIRFNEVLHTALASRWGHLATQCSLYSVKDFPIMPTFPFADVRCLPDIFHDKGYDTYFFYGGRLAFENRNRFYIRHQVKKMLSLEDYAEDITKNGWGASDFELFKKSKDIIEAGLNEPFYTTVFTLSNHSPRLLPADAPAFIDRSMPQKYQVLQYVDWFWGMFYDLLTKKYPHTIVIAVADHGGFLGDDIGLSNKTFADMRRLARIPLAFIIPGLPEKLKGVEVNHLISLADVGPTLFSLLQDTKMEQMFMGMDAFARNEPVLINWFGSLREVSQVDKQTRALTSTISEPRVIEKDTVKLFNSLHKWAKFGPNISFTPDKVVIKPGENLRANVGDFWVYLPTGESFPLEMGVKMRAKVGELTGNQASECSIKGYQRFPSWSKSRIMVLFDVEKCHRLDAH